MLIINADDYGKTRGTTDKILVCYKNDRVTSVTAMMFMEDSERASSLAREIGMEVGLHLNLNDRFTGNHHSPKLNECQERLSRFLNRNRLSLLLYNPLLRRDFEYTFKSQWDRFIDLYGKPPSHIDGHRHKHLCSTALFGGIIPAGLKVRRNFHFWPGEKGLLNRLYRSVIDWYLTRKYICTDYFFSINPFADRERIRRIGYLSKNATVELMVHPGLDSEFAFLMSREYPRLLNGVALGSYSNLQPRSAWIASTS